MNINRVVTSSMSSHKRSGGLYNFNIRHIQHICVQFWLGNKGCFTLPWEANHGNKITSNAIRKLRRLKEGRKKISRRNLKIQIFSSTCFSVIFWLLYFTVVNKLLLQCTAYDKFLGYCLKVSDRRHSVRYWLTTNNFQTQYLGKLMACLRTTFHKPISNG